jgi:uncharacterized integral membrane protein
MRREEPNQAGERSGQAGGDEALRAGQVDRDEAQRADREHFRELQRARQARVVKTLLALTLAVIFIVFILTNSQAVTVNFVFVKRKPPLIWVMFGCAVVGGLFGYLVGRPGKQIRLHRRRQGKEDR